MGKWLSFLLITVGISLLFFGGYQLLKAYLDESKRLEEAKAFISEEVVQQFDGTVADYTQGETIGMLYIPRLDRELPIIEGTDEEELAQGVGHYSATGYPGQKRQILLSGHRDTVFRQFGELKPGDEFHVKMAYGTFIYEFVDYEIVPADDTTVIDLTREEEYLTISTCYPFTYVGSAPDRYVIYAFPKDPAQ